MTNYALIIGYSPKTKRDVRQNEITYDPEENKEEENAKLIHKTLQDHSGELYRINELLIGEYANRKNILDKLGELKRLINSDPNASFFFYFSGMAKIYERRYFLKKKLSKYMFLTSDLEDRVRDNEDFQKTHYNKGFGLTGDDLTRELGAIEAKNIFLVFDSDQPLAFLHPLPIMDADRFIQTSKRNVFKKYSSDFFHHLHGIRNQITLVSSGVAEKSNFSMKKTEGFEGVTAFTEVIVKSLLGEWSDREDEKIYAIDVVKNVLHRVPDLVVRDQYPKLIMGSQLDRKHEVAINPRVFSDVDQPLNDASENKNPSMVFAKDEVGVYRGNFDLDSDHGRALARYLNRIEDALENIQLLRAWKAFAELDEMLTLGIGGRIIDWIGKITDSQNALNINEITQKEYDERTQILIDDMFRVLIEIRFRLSSLSKVNRQSDTDKDPFH